MDVNKIKIRQTIGNKEITLPIFSNWDLYAREDSVNIEKDKIVEKIIGKPTNYELCRYTMETVLNESKLIYELNFRKLGSNQWHNSYLSGITTFDKNDIEYLNKSFTKSFFKLDFYDTIDKIKQKIQFSVILNTTSGIKVDENGDLLYIPKFELDHIKIQESYYIYWYEENILNITDFYFNCKFFNAKVGEFTTFINKKTSDIPTDYIPQDNFFYKITINYSKKTYKIFDEANNQINFLNWYES